ncbi:MAG: proline hydroxylase, partial [Proteobacteria bacterium]|nr:proline hydroxylase [Pseudomonadota bacterium]
MQLSQEQIAAFEVEGYLFLPGAFTPAEVAVLAHEVPG